MRILSEIQKQRNYTAKEIERAKERIDALYHEIEQLTEVINREQIKVNEYDIVLKHCESLKGDENE